jgi:hypothetical protein
MRGEASYGAFGSEALACWVSSTASHRTFGWGITTPGFRVDPSAPGVRNGRTGGCEAWVYPTAGNSLSQAAARGARPVGPADRPFMPFVVD